MGAPLPVLAEGDGWIVVAKPPRLLVHRNANFPKADAALQRVRDQVGCRVYPIHRIDFAASGCLLFATRRELAAPLQAALTEGTKTYLAFVRGHFKPEGPVLVENPMKDDNGILKEATSVVQRLGASHDPRCSLLEVRPTTGRYHQVRRHVRDLDHPVIGDREHGDSRVNRWWRENHSARLGIHAHRLELAHDGRLIQATCPPFSDHAEVWRQLPWWPVAVERLPSLAAEPLLV